MPHTIGSVFEQPPQPPHLLRSQKLVFLEISLRLFWSLSGNVASHFLKHLQESAFLMRWAQVAQSASVILPVRLLRH